MEILVARDILCVNDLLAVVGPKVDADGTFGRVGQRPGVVLADCLHPYVEHFVMRREIAEAHPVGADFHRGPIRVSEQHVARNQVFLLALCRASWRRGDDESGSEQNGGERGTQVVHQLNPPDCR